MIIEFLQGNPDSYSWRGNNWWLLFSSKSAYIPYDQEESFGLGEHISVESWETMSADTFFNCQLITPHVDCSSPHLLSQVLIKQNQTEFQKTLVKFVSTIWLPSIRYRCQKKNKKKKETNIQKQKDLSCFDSFFFFKKKKQHNIKVCRFDLQLDRKRLLVHT